MEYKINFAELEKYAYAFSEKVCGSFFSSHTAITGSQILKFTNIDQVNFFIVQEIFEKWKEETSRLKSPYFDYDNAEIKEALRNFINKLSNFIVVKHDDFAPVVRKACYNTLWFSFLPDDFISKTYLTKTFIKKEELKEKARYIKIHKTLYAEFIALVEQEAEEEISTVELFRLFNKVYQGYKQSADEQTLTISSFSTVHYFDTDKILIKPVKHEVINTEEKPKPHPASTESPKEEAHEKLGTTINNQYIKGQATLNDLFRDKSPDPTTAAKGKIASIRDAISLNKKYLFVNALFKGNPEDFDKAINEIDSAPNEHTAREYAESYAQQLGWEKYKDETKELLELVSRKFL